VSNQATGDFLQGATVMVDGTSVSTTTERGGTFSLSAPAGTRTLTVSYEGLTTTQAAVSITAGATATRDVQLVGDFYKLDAVTVKGIREGTALAIQRQREAANVKTVVATDTFGNPAANPGELLQRLSGVTADIVGGEVRTVYIRGMAPGFSSLMVDGNRLATSTGTTASRDYQIEQLGTGNVESIELIKAVLPDMDANATAGYINIVTKRAFDHPPGANLDLTLGTMWRDRAYNGSPGKDKADNLDQFAMSFSDTFSVFGKPNNL